MNHVEFYCTTPRETSDLVNAWQRRHARYLEGCRLIAHTIAQVNSSKKLPSARAWMPLVTDPEKRNGKEPSEFELLAAKAAIRRAKENIGKRAKPIKIVD